MGFAATAGSDHHRRARTPACFVRLNYSLQIEFDEDFATKHDGWSSRLDVFDYTGLTSVNFLDGWIAT